MKLHKSWKEIDEAHYQYEELLVREIESLMGLVYSHGWKSQNVIAGQEARKLIRAVGGTPYEG